MKAKLTLGIFICTLLFSCKATKKETTQNIHRKWMMVQFEDFSKEKLIEKNCYLDLTDSANASAYMGCNSIGFSYTDKNDNSIAFNELKTTHMYCEDHAIESQFLNVSQSITSYRIKGHKLYLKTNSHKELIFVAEDWD
jgi:heat shock protein HslJ